jgi:CRISPR-associated exonuclease Cas4
MLCCEIPEGALFYGETRRREQVELTEELRAEVRAMLSEMHEYQRRGYTPKAKPGPHCRACSLNERCLPKLCKNPSVKAYIKAALETETK